jgi:competence protein ComEA
MLKKILTLAVMSYAAVCFAAVDVNKASVAELDSIKGIGPALSSKILDERKRGNFKDWNDFIARITGVGEGNASRFSAEGLTVNGTAFGSIATTPAAEAVKQNAPRAKAAPPAVNAAGK